MIIFQRNEGRRSQLTTPHEVVETPILIYGLSDVDMIDVVEEMNEIFLLSTDLLKVIRNEVQACSLVEESYPLHKFLGTDRSLIFESHLKSCAEQKNEIFELQELFFGDLLIMPPSETPVMTEDDFLADYLHSVPSFEISKIDKEVLQCRENELQKARIVLLKGSISDIERVGPIDIDPSKALFYEPHDQYLNYYPRLGDMAFDGFILPQFDRVCRDGFVIVTERASDELPLYNLNDDQYAMDTDPLAKLCQCDVCKKRSKIFIRKILKLCPSKGASYIMIHNVYQTKKIFEKNSIKSEKI